MLSVINIIRVKQMRLTILAHPVRPAPERQSIDHSISQSKRSYLYKDTDRRGLQQKFTGNDDDDAGDNNNNLSKTDLFPYYIGVEAIHINLSRRFTFRGLYMILTDTVFTARRIASAVLATAIPSVCPSVTRRYCVKTTARSTVQFALSDKPHLVHMRFRLSPQMLPSHIKSC